VWFPGGCGGRRPPGHDSGDPPAGPLAYNTPMHPDAAAFERAILADPSDRTTQLVYADWLDDHDDPEFAAVVRSEEFAAIPAVAAGAGLSLRVTWDTSRGLRQLTGTTGAITLLAATVLPTVRSLAGSLRSAALGLALTASPGRPTTAPPAEPVIRRVS
jgi:uncharacterized protein (TIGR02996 family)